MADTYPAWSLLHREWVWFPCSVGMVVASVSIVRCDIEGLSAVPTFDRPSAI